MRVIKGDFIIIFRKEDGGIMAADLFEIQSFKRLIERKLILAPSMEDGRTREALIINEKTAKLRPCLSIIFQVTSGKCGCLICFQDLEELETYSSRIRLAEKQVKNLGL